MKTRVLLLNLPAALVCLASLTASAAEIHVTPDSPGIQAAIESAADGDEIIVAPGVYQEHINFLGKAITVRSADPDDPEIVAATIIDGTGTGRCVTFDSDEGPESVLAGLTITNGNAEGEGYERLGGGVFCHASSPTIVGNVIIANIAEVMGGGLCSQGASPIIAGNSIIANNTTRTHGGGIMALKGSPFIAENVISGNRARDGGGVYCAFSDEHHITGNLIEGNTADSHGGGIAVFQASSLIAGNAIIGNFARTGAGVDGWRSRLVLTENLISSNVSDNTSGGLKLREGEAVLTGNVFTGNKSVFSGNISFSNSVATMTGDVIAGNSATGPGGEAFLGHSLPGAAGGLLSGDSYVFMSNVVITQNYAQYGPAMSCGGSTVTIVNSIIWGNHDTRSMLFEAIGAPDDPGPQADDQADFYEGNPSLQDGMTLTVINSVISSVPGPIELDTAAWLENVVVDVGNLNIDPLFVDPGHWDDNGTPDDYDDDFFVMGDYHLLPGSPCIDAGTNDIDDTATEVVEELPETDFDGLPRIMDGDGNGTLVVDIGAYEYLRGDVNYDGKLNVLDLLHVRNNLGKDPSSDPAARRADVNADGKVDITDLIAVRNLLSAW